MPSKSRARRCLSVSSAAALTAWIRTFVSTKRVTVVQRAAWEVVGRSYSSAASADGLQGLVLQSAQAVEFGLGSMVLRQADEVGADSAETGVPDSATLMREGRQVSSSMDTVMFSWTRLHGFRESRSTSVPCIVASAAGLVDRRSSSAARRGTPPALRTQRARGRFGSASNSERDRM